MLGIANDLARRALLDDPAQVHDRDPIREVGGRGEIVGDHQDAHPVLPEPVQERQDAGSDRNVQHRHRLVGDEKLGVEHQAGGDRDALALAAGQLVRIAVDEEVGRREPGPLQSLSHLGVALPLPRARRCTISGSSIVSRTVKRGSSDSYGS